MLRTEGVIASYMTVRPFEHSARQEQVSDSVIVDLDEDGRVLGIEFLGDVRAVAGLLDVVRAAVVPHAI